MLAFPLAMRLMTAPDFPFPLLGLVHVANRITVRRPIDAGEPLDLSVRAADLRPHDRGRQFDVVATATSRRRGGVARGLDVPVPVLLGTERVGQGRTEARPATGPGPHRVWRVPPRVGADYADVSGDHNPIHTSRLGARLFGFPRPIAHGMWSKARCLAALEGRLPDAYTVDVAFKLPILLPARVSFHAESTGGDWKFGVDSGRPHLAGMVTPP